MTTFNSLFINGVFLKLPGSVGVDSYLLQLPVCAHTHTHTHTHLITHRIVL